MFHPLHPVDWYNLSGYTISVLHCCRHGTQAKDSSLGRQERKSTDNDLADFS